MHIKMEKKKIKIVMSSLLIALSLILVVAFWRNNILLAVLLLIVGLVTLYIWKEKRKIYLYIVTGILGGGAEAIAISFGVWSYTNPTFLNLPLWLPFLWGEVGLYISTLILELKQISK